MSGVCSQRIRLPPHLVLRRFMRSPRRCVAWSCCCCCSSAATRCRRFCPTPTPTSTTTRCCSRRTPTLVRHQRARPGPVGPDLARHAEVDADRRVRGNHFDRHRRDRRIDCRLLRRLARPGADVAGRPDAGGAELHPDHDPHAAHQEFRQRHRARVAVAALRLDGELPDGPRHDHESAGTRIHPRRAVYGRPEPANHHPSRGAERGVDPDHRRGAERRRSRSWPKPG